MGTKEAILATLLITGPANMREICSRLYATRGIVDHERVCMELYGLIRECKVNVNLGIYSAVPA